MALKTSAEYGFGFKFARFMPLNDDKTIPTATRIIGGGGPFDFSGVTNIAAVELIVKIDSAAAVSTTINLSGASSQSAVTVDELVSALDTAFTGESLELDASKSSADDDRLKIASTNTASTPTWIQIYGEAARIAQLGMGFGLKWIKSNTNASLQITPTIKGGDTIEQTDAEGADNSILTDDYVSGFTAVYTDNAQDWEMRRLIMGGAAAADGDDDEFDWPTSSTEKVYFFGEAYYARYTEGDHLEDDIAGYVKLLLRKMTGQAQARTLERNWSPWAFDLKGTTYEDENSTLYGALHEYKLTVVAYEALSLSSV